MALKRRKRENKGDIDISPLIDVVFILLIFFMVSTTFIKDAQIQIDRPSSKSGTQANTEALRVYLDQGRLGLHRRGAHQAVDDSIPGARLPTRQQRRRQCSWWPTVGWSPRSSSRWSTRFGSPAAPTSGVVTDAEAG